MTVSNTIFRAVFLPFDGTGGRQSSLTDEELVVCQRMSTDPLSLIASKALNAAGSGDDGLTDEERVVCRKMNTDPAKFLEQKRKSKSDPDADPHNFYKV